MTKAERVRRMIARAQIKGTDQEKLVKQVMTRCEFTRGLAVTYIRKIKGTAALRETIKAMREKMGDVPAKPKAVKAEGKRGPGRPRKTEVVAPVAAPAAAPAAVFAWPTAATAPAVQEPVAAAA